MAVLNLETAWVNLASDLSQSLALWSADWSDGRSVPGDVRTYAGGRRRVVSRAGKLRNLSVTFPTVTGAQVETLVGWAGQTILLRDKRGRIVWCVYFSVSVSDRRDGTYDVTVQVAEVSGSAAV